VKEQSQTNEFLLLSDESRGSCALQNTSVAPKATTIDWMAIDCSKFSLILLYLGKGDVKCAVTGRIALLLL